MSAAYVCLRCSRRVASAPPSRVGRNGFEWIARGPLSRGRLQSTANTTRPTYTALDEADNQVNLDASSVKDSPRSGRRPPEWQSHQIHDLVAPNRSALETWHRLMALHAFSAPALPKSIEIGVQRSPEVRKAFRLFVRTALHDSPPDFPSLETIMRKFLERGLFRYQMLAYVLQEAQQALANAVFGSQKSQEVEEKRAIELLRNIIDAWRFTLGVSMAKLLLVGQKEAENWEGLPTLDEVQQVYKDDKPYMAIFSGLFSGRLDMRLEQQVAADSAWAFVCLQELKVRKRVPEQLADEWRPWTDLMDRLLAQTKASNRSQIRNILASSNINASETLLRAAVDSWHHSRTDGTNSLKGYTEGRTDIAPSSLKETKFEGPLEAKEWRTYLRPIVQRGEERRLLATWVEFRESSKAWESRDKIAAVIGEFLWAFARLRMRDMALGVWRAMQNEGLKPTITHWTAMFEVARLTGDRTLVPQLWSTMLHSGFLPPNQLWTTYITTLLRLRDWNTARQAVYAMGEQWKRMALEPPLDEDGSPKDFQSSMIPINAAISGFTELERFEPIKELLQFAEEQGLAPSIETYNIILRSAVQRKDSAGIQMIFAAMKAARCDPDVITFTIYIDGLVKDPQSPFHSGTPEEAQATIANLFADITALGLQPTSQTYTTLLHNLLGGESPNIPAAQAVLKQMDAQGIPYSSHAYTIIASHYFKRQPPDLEAIERLRARIEAEGTKLDMRFYDRLVQGYARVGERDRMLSVLQRIPDTGQLRLWTLNEALALCIRDSDAESARDLVHRFAKKLNSSGLSKGERLEIRRWRELVGRLKLDGVIEQVPPPVVFRKVNNSRN